MWHTVLIALHAISGTIALLVGCLAHRARAMFRIYFWSLVATIAFLGAAVAAEWPRLDALSRGLFGAFAVLGLVMVWLAFDARRLPAPSPRYVDRVGFTVVALFDAFVVITVLNAGASVALVVASGVVVAVAGHFVLRAVKSAVGARSGERTLVQQ